MTFTKEEIIAKLNRRYATKKFDPTKKLTDEELDFLLESARLTASSFGLQPWKFLVVKDPEVREKLREVAWKQSQVTDASHLIVICSLRKMTEEHVDRHVKNLAETNGVEVGTYEGYRKRMVDFIREKSPHEQEEWMARQTYIALGNLLACCAMAEIDSCPMEGFDRGEVDGILGLSAKGLTAMTMLPVGFRSANDDYAKRKKTRFKKEDVVEVV